jgi:hypothetical protein
MALSPWVARVSAARPTLHPRPHAGAPMAACRPTAARSASGTRARIASIQQGWRSGRAEAGRAADGTAEQPGDTGPSPDYGRAE